MYKISHRQSDLVAPEEHYGTGKDCEDELVDDPNLDADLPEVELEASLRLHRDITESLDIVDNLSEDAAGIEGDHFKGDVVSGQQMHGRRLDGVLAFVDKVENFNDDGVAEQRLHVHLQHEVEAVLLILEVEDGLAHHAFQVDDIMVAVEEGDEALLDVLVDLVALRRQRVHLLLLDLKTDAVHLQGIFHRVVLGEHRVLVDAPLAAEDEQEGVDQVVDLLDVELVEMLLDEEKLLFVVQH
eukprot:CAMPEP_0170483192 /NCGR_PEP_ID=MMETSP0208-20121228/2914_1 /TAXON_ID=197538 /ORGANISM="Strombidium inclinatum, Strain S3" /LENGTH=240 /DNA_ID=CAMNT_0010756137 /DNA_START=2112 /DNA_END=2834 /DNA_ORIENTATION=+